MFALLFNLYKFLRERSERKVTLVILGVDNAGKTTLLHTLKGEHDKETSPTFGFNSSTHSAQELGLGGKSLILQVFDLGGGQSIRRVWKSYLAEVHGVVFVVDAADRSRFDECEQVLRQTIDQKHLHGKPILVLANKQDLNGAASSAEVASHLGLPDLKANPFHIKACIARTPPGQAQDPSLHEGLRWLLSVVGSMFPALDARVQRDTDEVKQEDLRRKKEREERARKIKEERAQQQQEEEQRRAEEAATAAAIAAAKAELGMAGHSGGLEGGGSGDPSTRVQTEVVVVPEKGEGGGGGGRGTDVAWAAVSKTGVLGGQPKEEPGGQSPGGGRGRGPTLPGGIESPTLTPIAQTQSSHQPRHFSCSPPGVEESVTFCPLASQPSPKDSPHTSGLFANGLNSPCAGSTSDKHSPQQQQPQQWLKGDDGGWPGAEQRSSVSLTSHAQAGGAGEPEPGSQLAGVQGSLAQQEQAAQLSPPSQQHIHGHKQLPVITLHPPASLVAAPAALPDSPAHTPPPAAARAPAADILTPSHIFAMPHSPAATPMGRQQQQQLRAAAGLTGADLQGADLQGAATSSERKEEAACLGLGGGSRYSEAEPDGVVGGGSGSGSGVPGLSRECSGLSRQGSRSRQGSENQEQGSASRRASWGGGLGATVSMVSLPRQNKVVPAL